MMIRLFYRINHAHEDLCDTVSHYLFATWAATQGCIVCIKSIK